MNWNTRFLTMVAMMMLSFAAKANNANPSDPYAEEFVLASTDTIPFTERYDNFTSGEGGNQRRLAKMITETLVT